MDKQCAELCLLVFFQAADLFHKLSYSYRCTIRLQQRNPRVGQVLKSKHIKGMSAGSNDNTTHES